LEDYVKKIGVLFGMENTFPGALVDRINAMELDGIKAEFVHLLRHGFGCIRGDAKSTVEKHVHGVSKMG